MSAYYFNFNECQDLSLTEIATQKCTLYVFFCIQMKICKKSIPGNNYLPEMLSLPYAVLSTFLPDKQRSAVRPSLQSAVCSTPTALRFCRSTAYTSCRFRTDTDRSDIPLPQHASSACSSQTHP